VLAIYKETKIQTPLITLNISTEQSENTGNLNYAIKDALYDENTIDQKLLDFVNNVNFSLDYTENDYDTDKDGKKGEILINNIIIGYKNSKNTFKVSNSATKEAISNAINNDSGITKRASNILYKNVQNHYLLVLSASSFYVDYAKYHINDVSNELNKKSSEMLISSSIFTTLGAISLGILIVYTVKNIRVKVETTALKKFLSLVAVLFSFCALIGGVILAGKKNVGNINDSLDKLKKFEN
jgi:hypothetical protein